ncbi:MtnX-like HAD-IB family phosphatase [Snodgrassella alvi]|uniref:MtnX-like HAD-IB family phosphatase n=1 Tax=Snodgrassella alvi TaxID=1196083 RepID=UPI000C1F07EF|nr:MtnX-like HAD-IB family phosphatase [Snodgrassella alvi]
MSCFTPLVENQTGHNPFFYANGLEKYIILCDFDGTISEKDVTDTLLDHFGNDQCALLEQQWLKGIIGSRECMRQQIANMQASQIELDSVLAQIKIDPTFSEFIDIAREAHLNVQIVSDGLDYAIQSILKRYNLDLLPIYANRLLHNQQQGWKLDFPYTNQHCLKASGNCKCQHRRQLAGFQKIFYVGDGTSDFCVADKVDLVFAKDKLIDFCRQHGIHHYPIKNFGDVVAILPNLIKTSVENHCLSPA